MNGKPTFHFGHKSPIFTTASPIPLDVDDEKMETAMEMPMLNSIPGASYQFLIPSSVTKTPFPHQLLVAVVF